MRMVFGLVLIAGVGLAGFAVHMLKGFVDAKNAELERAQASRVEPIQTEEVLVMARQMRYGERLTPEDVRVVAFPMDAIPDGAYRSLAELFPENSALFRSITRSVEAAEVVLPVKVTEPGREAGITSRLKPGMRAFAIRVDVTSGVSGFLRPGDNVDVYWTGRALDQEITKLIQPGVNLIAIDQSADEDVTGASVARTVTVQATPQQVAALAQAQSSGRLTLALVGVLDEVATGPVEIDQNTLLGIEEQQAVEVQEEVICTARTRRGTEIVEVEIPCVN